MQFIDLKTQYQRVEIEVRRRIEAVFAHGQFIMGPEIQELETRLAAMAGVRHAITCASGTDALLMPLMALGIGPGDAVFTTPFTFIATAEVICLLGATPIFVDIDPETFNMDPARLEKAIQAVTAWDNRLHPLPNSPRLKPKAIIPVDLFGLPADYDAIMAIARQDDLFVLEDAAQSFGALYKGRPAGSLGDVAATSFFPAKPLGCYGDGGAVFTDNANLAREMISIRIHGQGTDKYNNIRIGLNARMDTLQAAMLLAKLDIFPEEIELRNQIAQKYSTLLAGSGIRTPFVPKDLRCVFAQFSLRSARKSEILERLKKEGIPAAVYYPTPLHLQTAFTGLGYRQGDFPVAEETSRLIFSIPMHPYLEDEDLERIVSAILRAKPAK